MSLERGTLLYQTGRYEQAEQEFRAALGVDPNDPRPHAMLAHCLLERERFGDAEAAARQAVALDPDWDGGYAAVGAVLRRRGDLAGAADALDHAIGLDPFGAEHRAALAFVRLDQRRWADALAAADDGLAVDPAHLNCLNARGAALTQLGRKDEAAATIRGALARNPHSPQSHANQGWARLHAGDHRAALEHFREALRLSPDSESARAGMVEALKARHLVYRLMLRYFLFMSRLPRQAQWGIIVGGYVGFQLLNGYAERVPAARPFVLPILGAYLAFAVMTWLAAPLFNLLLRVSRFGRFALSRDQRVGSNWLGGCLGSVGLLVGFWAVTRDERYAIAAIAVGLMSIPLSAVFRCPAGWPRQAMGAYAAVLAAVGAAAVGPLFVNLGPAMSDAVPQLIRAFGWGLLLANVAANYLAAARVRR